MRISEAWSDAPGRGWHLAAAGGACQDWAEHRDQWMCPTVSVNDWREPKKGQVRVGRSQEPWTRGLLLTCQESYLDNRDLLSHFHPKPDALERLAASECHLSFPSSLNYLCSWESHAEEFSSTNWQQAWWHRKYRLPFVVKTCVILPSSTDMLGSTYIGYWIRDIRKQ